METITARNGHRLTRSQMEELLSTRTGSTFTFTEEQWEDILRFEARREALKARAQEYTDRERNANGFTGFGDFIQTSVNKISATVFWEEKTLDEEEKWLDAIESKLPEA